MVVSLRSWDLREFFPSLSFPSVFAPLVWLLSLLTQLQPNSMACFLVLVGLCVTVFCGCKVL